MMNMNDVKSINIDWLNSVSSQYDNRIRNFKNEVICHLVAMQLYENGVRATDFTGYPNKNENK